jgi:hypothetical protein
LLSTARDHHLLPGVACSARDKTLRAVDLNDRGQKTTGGVALPHTYLYKEERRNESSRHQLAPNVLDHMRALTDFGDGALVLPLSAVMLVWLLRFHSAKAALLWVVAVTLCVAGTAFLKVFLYACPPVVDLVSPSGHTSFSMLVYGGIVLAIAAEARGWRRVAVLAAGTALIVGIAVSRLVLNMHSALEVGVGILIGTLTLTLFALGYLCSRSEEKPLRPLILPAIAIITVLHGQELRAETLLHAISRHLHLSGKICVPEDRVPR